MASEYPFHRVIGVELLPALHQVAEGNIARYRKAKRRCEAVESVCLNAIYFDFPREPLVVYLFNPLGEVNLMTVVENLIRSLREQPQRAYVIYHNPLLEHVLTNGGWRKLRAEPAFSLFAFGG
jgi:hypothetical protein